MDENKIQELQILEQNLHNLLLQKQSFQMELSEIEAAINEIGKSGEEVFKITGQIMIKTTKKEIREDLLNKQKILNMRLKPFEKQESVLSKKIEETREEFMKEMNKDKK